MILGSRKSRLAMIQTEMVADAIREKFPELKVEIEGMDTEGDLKAAVPLAQFGGKGAFTAVIEREMLDGSIDMAVHSAKDMPLEMTKGLAIRAVLKRGDERDVWVSLKPEGLGDMPEGTVIGTGSRRRSLQALEMNPGLQIRDIRGNVPTRLKKLSEGLYDGIIVAAAGLQRLGLTADISDRGSFMLEGCTFYYVCLEPEKFLPAAGQGVIAVESKKDSLSDIFDAINDPETWVMLAAERAFLYGIGGGCNEAAGICTKIMRGHLVIQAKYAPAESTEMAMTFARGALTGTLSEDCKMAEQLGIKAAKRLMKQGG